jgi:hypothetical protein
MRKVVDLIEKLNANEVALYLDKGGLMHADDHADHAMQSAVGHILITDECEAEGGMPIINGVRVEVWGAGYGYVYLSKYKRSVKTAYNVSEKTLHIDDSMKLDPIKLPRAVHAAYRKANEFYMAILDDKDE